MSVDEAGRILDRELLALGVAIAEGVDFRDAVPMARALVTPRSRTVTLGV
jgi:hypothetical protein